MALRSLGARIGRLNDLVASALDLNGVDIEILDHIGRFGPVSPGELADSMHIHPATMTGIIDRLENGGWVVRERAPEDRRKVQLKALRKRGPELVRLYAPMNTAIGEVCEGLTNDQLKTVVEFLRSVATAAERSADTL